MTYRLYVDSAASGIPTTTTSTTTTTTTAPTPATPTKPVEKEPTAEKPTNLDKSTESSETVDVNSNNNNNNSNPNEMDYKYFPRHFPETKTRVDRKNFVLEHIEAKKVENFSLLTGLVGNLLFHYMFF